MQRVAPRRVVYVFDTDKTDSLWLVADYFPEILELSSERAAPSIAARRENLDVHEVRIVPVSSRLDEEIEARGVARLREDLRSGAWDARYGDLRAHRSYGVGYRLVIAGRAGEPDG